MEHITVLNAALTVITWLHILSKMPFLWQIHISDTILGNTILGKPTQLNFPLSISLMTGYLWQRSFYKSIMLVNQLIMLKQHTYICSGSALQSVLSSMSV